MAVHFYQTSQFEEIRLQIEQYLYDSVLDLEQNVDLALQSVEQFAKALDRLFNTLEQMYQTTGIKNTSAEASFLCI